MLLRRTVSEIQPFKVLGFELPILTLRGHSWSKVMVDFERSYMISYLCLIVTLVVGCDVYEIFAIFIGTIFRIPVLTLRGRRRSFGYGFLLVFNSSHGSI